MTAKAGSPERTCIGCRNVFEQSALVRYVVAPDGHVLVDERRKLPGRGAYTCPTSSCVEQAVGKRQFERVFRGDCLPVSVEDLVEKIKQAQLSRMASLLGMARKSGQLFSGSNMVLDALGHSGRVALVLLAEDVSSGIAEKVKRKADAQEIPIVRLFSKADQGQMTGRAEHSVLGLPDGQLTDAFQHVWHRYKAVLGEN